MWDRRLRPIIRVMDTGLPMIDAERAFRRATRARRRSALAATFVAGLQLAKDGQIELRQTERFGPIHLRKRSDPR